MHTEYKIVGVHTEYKIVVYNFPAGHSDAFGGTSNCVLWYGDDNLRLNEHEEWRLYKIPHVSGYIEEIAHNFVSTTKAQFGWEMVGWSIGTKVSSIVAGNAHHRKSASQTRRGQSETLRRYHELGQIFPHDLPENQIDRIHAYILWQCEQKYGPNFWRDFFREVRKEYKRLTDAVNLTDGDSIRNERYKITIECFNHLPNLNFKSVLQENGISLTVDIKSMHPTEPGWNRRLH